MTQQNEGIAVLVSIGRHPVSGVLRRSRNDSLALEMGRLLAGPNLRVVHAGDPQEPALQEYLALGAAEIEALALAPGQDIVPALAARLKQTRLILCGSRSEGGQDSGLLPYLLAEALGIPVVGSALGVTIDGRIATVQQFLPKGKRRQVEVTLPAVVAVHPLASVTPRYAYARKVAGRIQPQPAFAPKDTAAAAWQVVTASRKPQKLKAAEKRSGHARMLSAIVSESKGGAVISNGSAGEKAQAILAYLREHRLIDF